MKSLVAMESRGVRILVKWSLIFHCVSCQFVGSEYNERSRNREPYHFFTNLTTSGIQKTAYQENYSRDYDTRDVDEREQPPFVNATHRVRGNVTEFYDPHVYGGGNASAGKTLPPLVAKGVAENRRLQTYRGDGFYNNAYDVTAADTRPGDRKPGYEEIINQDNNVPEDKRLRGDATRRYDDSVTKRSYPGTQQFGPDNAYPSGSGSGSNYQRSNYESSYGRSASINDPSNPYGRDQSNPYNRNVNDPSNPYGRSDQSNPYGSNNNNNSPPNPYGNNNNSPPNPYGNSNNGPQNPYGNQNNPYNRNPSNDPNFGRDNQYNRPPYQGSGSNTFGSNTGFSERPQPYPFPNQYPGQNIPYGSSGRDTFDPGNPHKNIWNEHWSTTTDRPTAPGVLGKWRPDLQGRQRPEDINQVPTPVYVTTAYGRIQGFRVKLYDGPWVPLPARPGVSSVEKVQNTVASFTGIPYARPPVQEGRFRPPRPHTGWQLLQAVEFGPACPQPARFFGYTAGIVQVDEDCLYLNVYSPDVGSGAQGAPYPVIFYIHDGDFIHGASQQFPPHQLVAWYKLVVVTVNFRLGALGFLSTTDEYSPGNYGMLDLSLALKWVHDNIRAFNGDPDRINVVGLGSGAAAAGLLMLAPRSRPFVKNVVAMEGAPTADWAAIVDKYRLQNTTELYSLKLGCWQQYEQTSWKLIQCLRSRSWQELANLELEPDVGTWPWSPAVDKEFRVPKDDYVNDWKEEDWRFLPDDPENLLKHGEYPYVKYMTGFSRQSAADLLYANKSLAPNYVVTREWFDQMIHRWVKKYNYTLNPEGVYSAIKYAYTYWPDPHNFTHLREEYIDFLSDALYRAPIDQTVKLLLARGIQVHMYNLNYTLEGLRLPFWREVPRGLEYYLLSGAPFMDPEFYPERLRVDRSAWTEGDRNMSNFFMSSLANLAHYGQPTHHEVLGIYWERATPADLKYLALNGTNNSTMQRNYKQRELTFWTEYMPSVIGRLVPTYPPTTEYWWEPNEPLQIAFWTVSGVCLILIVVLVACCLLWRTTKKQRDRIYEDFGLTGGPPGIGTIVGDEISEYAETVKTHDSMDSGVKLPVHHHPAPGSQNSANIMLQQMYPTPPQIHHRDRDRFPTPKRQMRDRGRDTPQTQV